MPGTAFRFIPPKRAAAYPTTTGIRHLAQVLTEPFEELATGRARSLQELAKRDDITRRYIRRLVGLAFLSPQLVEAILQGRQSGELTVTRLSQLDLPLDWTEQHRLLAS